MDLQNYSRFMARFADLERHCIIIAFSEQYVAKLVHGMLLVSIERYSYWCIERYSYWYIAELHLAVQQQPLILTFGILFSNDHGRSFRKL